MPTLILDLNYHSGHLLIPDLNLNLLILDLNLKLLILDLSLRASPWSRRRSPCPPSPAERSPHLTF